MKRCRSTPRRQLRRLAAHEVALPEKVIGWYYLRRAGLSQQQRQLIMSTITTSTLSLDSVRKAVKFVIGQDQTPEGPAGRDTRFNKLKDTSIYNLADDSWSYEPEPDDAYYEDEESWEIGPEDSLSQIMWQEDPAPQETDEEQILMAMDAASEYDDIMANYVEARSKLNQLRVSRGYYPVVAMVPDQKSYTGGAGKGKGKKGKVKGKGKQQPKPPSAKARGRAALGAIKCLRCGRAGHMAANCPSQAQNKRKTEADPESEIHMVVDTTITEEVNIFDEDGTESEPDDTAMFDCGAASVIIGTQQLRRLMKALLMKGCDVASIPAWKCEKGLRFGNGNRDVTTLCVLVPTYFKNKRRDILMYVMEGSTPCLLGRPALEAFGITINYRAKTVAWGEDEDFEPAALGKKGEFIVHLVEDHQLVKTKTVADQVFIPEDFDTRVFEEVTLQGILQVADDAFLALENNIETAQVSVGEENSKVTMQYEPDKSVMEDDHAQKVISQARCTHEDEELDKLHPGKLNKLYYETVAAMKELDMDICRAKDLENYMPPRTHVIWEVYAGEGKVTKTANRRVNCTAIRFSREDGWDFSLAAHRKAFFRKQEEEKPDAILYSPMCKLWSPTQELNKAKNPAYGATLEAKRLEDHDTHLTFVAVSYEKQRKDGRLAIVEHPWHAKSWETPAFQRMQGYDTRVDMCEYGLVLPDDDGNINPVQKATCLRVTSPMVHYLLWKECSGDHWHTHLEGYALGLGTRTTLAENYTQVFATAVVNAIVTHLENQDDVQAVDDYKELPEEKKVVEAEPIRANRELRAKVGGRAVEYVQRLHKNLGHCGADVLVRMLREVQATADVLEAAQKYPCPLCDARKGPKQAPPASALKCTEFNERVQVDSHWILNDDSTVKVAHPAPGTPAAKKKEKEKAEKVPQGRRCVMTVVDHATRYCAIRILNSERAEEFTKGLERCWLKHFGIPKILRIDEAKGWASKHVREWASSRGITLELQPAEQHSWLGVVERKHQVVRRCLELYQDEVGRHDKASLKEAAVYVPHAINQLSFHKGFSPQQWVFGKTMTLVHGLSGELFNPGQDALDEQGVFAEVQQRRAAAAKAFISADSDAKLRRAFTQKFQEQKESLVVGQQCWYWRNAGAGILRKARWRGPARVVAIEDNGDARLVCYGCVMVHPW